MSDARRAQKENKAPPLMSALRCAPVDPDTSTSQYGRSL